MEQLKDANARAVHEANKGLYNRQLTEAHRSRLGGHLRPFNEPPQAPPQAPPAGAGPVIWPTNPATRAATIDSDIFRRWQQVKAVFNG